MISVGIDVSKNKSTFCAIRFPEEIVIPPTEIEHSCPNLTNILNQLQAYEEEVRFVMETTGHYHWSIAQFLFNQGEYVSCVNALKIKKYMDQNIRKVKTDKTDALTIAKYGISYWNDLERFVPLNDIYMELRTLSRQYYHVTALSSKAKVNLENLIDRTMPNLHTVLLKNTHNNRTADFVLKYWHYENLTLKSEQAFIADLKKWSKKKGYIISATKASEIYNLAEKSIPSLPCSQSTKIAIEEAVHVLYESEESRKRILSQMQSLAKTLPEYEIVRSMSGVADILAPRLIAEIGDIKRYHNKHSLIAYAGLDAPPYQSGSFTSTTRHITKRGNKYLRKTGFEIMQMLVMHKPEGDVVFEYIIQKKLEGKRPKVAMIAGLNKFLRMYYGKVSELYYQLETDILAA